MEQKHTTGTQAIRVMECFAGIGAQSMALKNIGINHKVVAISEWDINALISYALIHKNKDMFEINIPNQVDIISELSQYTFSHDGKRPLKDIKRIPKAKLELLYKAHKVTHNMGSITEIDPKQVPCLDLFTYSFPCQSISMQGKQEGLTKNTGTSSSLIWEVQRILIGLKEENKLPAWLLMENVPNLLSEKFNTVFNVWLEFLNSLGYQTEYGILNSCEFGIPQNRRRVFAISKLNSNLGQEKPSSPNEAQFIPKGKRTTLRISDILKPNSVLSQHLLPELEPKLKQIPDTIPVKPSGICSTELNDYTKFKSENMVYHSNGFAPTITATGAMSRIKIIDAKQNKLRYLTGLEHMLLMGFSEQDWERISNQPFVKIGENIIKKQAGNSIVVPVLEAIFYKIFR